MRIFKIILWVVIGVVVIAGAIIVITPLIAATNIDSVNRYAWSDGAGWWDFYGTDSVNVSVGSNVTGYASSSIGEMSLNCNSTPIGNICSSSNFAVVNPAGSGNLSGCAWNDALGWISFWCGDTDCDGDNIPGDGDDICASSNYQVTIDSNGLFHGYAWNDIEGWISFNCSDWGGCGASDYKVQTAWKPGRSIGFVESITIDTSSVDGSTLQSIIWQGSQSAGTSVDFQIAASNCPNGATNPPTCDTGAWTFKGPGGSATEFYGSECPIAGTTLPGAGPDKAICVEKAQSAGFRYLRYKVRLQSDTAQNLSPEINDIILNWSK